MTKLSYLWRCTLWLWWQAYYTVAVPRDLHRLLLMMNRCRAPWWKFEPSVHHNDDGKQWEIWLSDDPDYVSPGHTVRAQVHFSEDTGEVTGLTIFDESLRAISERERGLRGEQN